MKVCILVYIVAVQCGGVTDHFDMGSTVTDGINSIVRRLRQTSSEPWGEDLEINVFSSHADERINNTIQANYIQAGMHEMKHEKWENKALRNNKLRSILANSMEDKSETRENQSEKNVDTFSGPDHTNGDSLKFSERKVLNVMDNNVVSTCSKPSQLLQNSSVKYEETLKSLKLQENEKQPENVAYYSQPSLNQTQSPSLLLPSCSYIDLTTVQSLCGPGYRAKIDKQDQQLLHSIFFDSSSGHVIYAVHREQGWQCCKTRKNLTNEVSCTLGTRC